MDKVNQMDKVKLVKSDYDKEIKCDQNISTYLGNPRVRAAGAELEWSADMIREFLLCRDNIIYFVRKYMKIVSADEGYIPFDMYDYQEDLINLLNDERYVIGLLPRQSGKCLCINTPVRIKNKKTGEVKNVRIGELYKMCKLSNRV